VEACPTGALESIAKELTVSEALKLALADEGFYNASGGGITFTGGEPLAQGKFILEAARIFKQYGLSVCLDTSGYAPEKLVCKIAPYLDLVLYDLKNMDDHKHRRLTGVSNEIILSNARKLASLGVSIQFSIPLVPGLTDDEENLSATAMFVSQLEHSYRGTKPDRNLPSVRILPYHGSACTKYERRGIVYHCKDLQVPDRGDCDRAAAFFINQGLETIIGGLV
jgi:pyruvate formate lyase activating enzyme